MLLYKLYCTLYKTTLFPKSSVNKTIKDARCIKMNTKETESYNNKLVN